MPVQVDSLVHLMEEVDEMLLLLGIMPLFAALLAVCFLLYIERQELRSRSHLHPWQGHGCQ